MTHNVSWFQEGSLKAWDYQWVFPTNQSCDDPYWRYKDLRDRRSLLPKIASLDMHTYIYDGF